MYMWVGDLLFYMHHYCYAYECAAGRSPAETAETGSINVAGQKIAAISFQTFGSSTVGLVATFPLYTYHVLLEYRFGQGGGGSGCRCSEVVAGTGLRGQVMKQISLRSPSASRRRLSSWSSGVSGRLRRETACEDKSRKRDRGGLLRSAAVAGGRGPESGLLEMGNATFAARFSSL